MKHVVPVALLAATVLGLHSPTAASAGAEERNLNELRNTVVNLLQGLVDRGVLTREQAQKMVEDAQKKAADEAQQQQQAEQNAVRVPYVPEIVKDEIRNKVVADLGDKVTQNVVERAEQDGWGVPAALPDWVRRIRWYGDVRVRGQGDMFADDNLPSSYLNFQTINEKGGIGRAGVAAFYNTSADRQRGRTRLRIGFDANLGYGWGMGARLATGSLKDAVSTNQTLGNSSARYNVGLDLAYLEWSGERNTGRQTYGFSAGRIRNPWLSSDLVWDQDLSFEGIAANYHLGLVHDDPASRFAFLTIGAFPLQENEIDADKWLYGAQLGLDWKFAGGSRARIGGAIYEYRGITGRRNTFDSDQRDYTAPQFVQRGNTMYDIRNDTDVNTNLFALAADYRLLNATAVFDWRISQGYRVSFSGDYVKNIGYDAAAVLSRTGIAVPARTTGYQGEIGIGSAVVVPGSWRAYAGYRYLQRDAVIDAFTDSDFRLGGTDARGFFVGGEYFLNPRVSARVRYMSGTEIDGPPLSIDVLQLDLTASF